MKLSLPIFIGLSVLTLAACDKQEAKTTEKSTALTENSIVPKAEEKTDTSAETEMAVGTETAVEQAEIAVSQKSDELKNDEIETKSVSEKSETEAEQTKPKTEKTNLQSAVENTDTQPVVSNDSKKVSKKITKVNRENRYLKEQKAMLKVLESQYQQVRCTPETAKLGENSFCRQEERRLFLEIERVKNEIRLNR
ncbi:hypothetical protein BKK54_05685 [Rodentibacter genomosp. 1]|uniref:Lipoprotein n=1 Tax=Rodentibacter genomosp. 1 TaxID=1908264 RepID=A0A1V3J5S2_9PAST|nr:hypothetical protein [Rodentibacter genomosp. 1]OOF50576.1 hypothetical protein BKK54_05685 [Rodentibacter genomosp. 1]